ncbi:MAG TPA: diguanylate cyclase, partial [Acidothermaceae bacterium]|nr:diguanylate cyclase [Acidothermaceae bacterium]
MTDTTRIELRFTTSPVRSSTDAAVLTRAIAYLQLASIAMAIVWLLLPAVGDVDERGMIVVAAIATVFAVTLLRVAGRIPPRWLVPVALTNITLIGGYMFFGGDTAAAPFGLLYVGAAVMAGWFLSRFHTIVQVSWMAASYGLAIWLAHAPGEPAWPRLSAPDFGVLLVGTVALLAITLLVMAFKRRVIDRDERLAKIVEFSRDAIIGHGRDGLVNVWNAGAQRLYGYQASEVIGQSLGVLVPPELRGEEVEILRQVLAGGQIEDHQTERVRKDGSVVTVSLSVGPIRDSSGRVAGSSAIARDLTSALQAQETIRRQALYDELTGLPNRTLFLDRVGSALARNERHSQTLAVFFIDLDRFKLVNDSLGHGAGDELLRQIARRLTSTIREGDTLARLGGDEFALLCEELPSEVAATRIASALNAAIDEPVVLSGDDRVVSASIGIVISNGASTATELLRDADAAMYQAKTAGRGRAELFDEPMRARILGRVQTESALRCALAAADQIYVHYQPLVSLRSGRIVGAEALARWRHPDWGPVSPFEFVSVAEDSGLIHELGAQIMRRAAHDSAAWQGIPNFAGVAINVSIRQL